MSDMARSRLDRLLSNANSIDIILYIHDNPGCRKSDIYANITRNIHTLDKIHEFRDSGIIDMVEDGNRAIICLTKKGDAIAEFLLKIKCLVENDS